MAIKAILVFQLEIPYIPPPILIYLGRWGHGVFFIFHPEDVGDKFPSAKRKNPC
jgi:hypothetical protein